LIPRLSALSQSIAAASNPQSFFNETVEKLQKNPSPDAPPTNSPNPISYDAMVLSLLLKVAEDVKGKHQNQDMGKVLKEAIDVHVVELGKRQEDFEKNLETEEKERNKHITSDDIHDGFDSKVRFSFSLLYFPGC
jgi:cell division cycle protein 37